MRAHRTPVHFEPEPLPSAVHIRSTTKPGRKDATVTKLLQPPGPRTFRDTFHELCSGRPSRAESCLPSSPAVWETRLITAAASGPDTVALGLINADERRHRALPVPGTGRCGARGGGYP